MLRNIGHQTETFRGMEHCKNHNKCCILAPPPPNNIKCIVYPSYSLQIVRLDAARYFFPRMKFNGQRREIQLNHIFYFHVLVKLFKKEFKSINFTYHIHLPRFLNKMKV